MKALATALLVLVAACGEGRVILNVDVLSFLSTSDSTMPYNVPGGVPQVDTTTSQMFILPPGLGKSSVDSVSANAAAVIENSAGSGTVRFDVFFAKTQGSLYTGTPYLTTGDVTIPGPDTLQLLPPSTVSVADTVFDTDSLWVGIRARLGTNAGPNMVGQMRLTALGVRIVVQEKVF